MGRPLESQLIAQDGASGVMNASGTRWRIAAGSVDLSISSPRSRPDGRMFGSPGFGRIFSAKNPREMQFGLCFAF